MIKTLDEYCYTLISKLIENIIVQSNVKKTLKYNPFQ